MNTYMYIYIYIYIYIYMCVCVCTYIRWQNRLRSSYPTVLPIIINLTLHLLVSISITSSASAWIKG